MVAGKIVPVGQASEIDIALPINPAKVIKMSLDFGNLVGEDELFGSFMNDIRFQNRFFLPHRPRKWIDELLTYVKERRTVTLEKGKTFYRARDHGFELAKGRPEPFPADQMGTPPAKDCSGRPNPAGRLNPDGIPYLYLASDADTARAEMRPSRGAWLSVARFPLVRDVRVADLRRREVSDSEYSKWSKSEKREELRCGMVGFLFSRPHHPADTLGYIPSQYLAEALKNGEYDGVMYDSSLGSGYNLTLFDPTAVPEKAEEVSQKKVRRVHYEYE